MKYESLQDLLSHSSSTREYFLSLPISTQLALHESNFLIHTAADLHYFQLSHNLQISSINATHSSE